MTFMSGELINLLSPYAAELRSYAQNECHNLFFHISAFTSHISSDCHFVSVLYDLKYI